MGIRIGLLVVLAPGALQPPVLDRAVVAHLRPAQVGQVLADALVDVFVVVDAIGARRDKERDGAAQERERRHLHDRPPREAAAQIAI